MSSQSEREDTDALIAKIEAAKAASKPKVVKDGPIGQAQFAWRMVVELVTAVGMGAALGFGLDKFFGTMPILLAAFTLLGFAAGVNLMLRTAKEIQGRSDGK